MPMAKISLIQRPSRCGSPMPAMPRCTAHWALRMRASRVPKERPRTTVQLHQTKCAHPRLNLQPYKRRHVNRIAARFLAGGTTAQRGCRACALCANDALRPTERGIELIRKCPSALSDPVTTAKWETALGLIEQGKMTPQQFGAMIRTMTAQLVEAIKGVQFDLNRFGVKPSKDTR